MLVSAASNTMRYVPLLAALLASCSGSSGNPTSLIGSCQQGVNLGSHLCFEYRGEGDVNELIKECRGSSYGARGIWTEGVCPTAGRVGACRGGTAPETTEWYYTADGDTAAGTAKFCAQVGGTFIAP